MKHYCNTDFLQDIRDLKDRQLLEWWHSGSPSTSSTLKKKFRVQNSNGKVLALFFWDQVGILLIDYFPKGTSINTEYYSSLLVLLKPFFQFQNASWNVFCGMARRPLPNFLLSPLPSEIINPLVRILTSGKRKSLQGPNLEKRAAGEQQQSHASSQNSQIRNDA